MTLRHSLFVIAAGIGLLQTGCLADSNEVEAFDSVGLKPLEGNGGSQGGNGLLDTIFEANMMPLYASTGQTFAGTNAYLDDLADSKDGILTLEYAAACALPSGGTYTIHDTSFYGGGLLTTTAGWPSNALGAQEKYDLMECMIAHINPFENYVQMRLSGEAVANDPNNPDLDDFTFEEALWIAYADTAGRLRLEAWPMGDLSEECGSAAHDAVELRACGYASEENGGDCPVTVRDDYLNHCTQDQDGDWSCEGHRAILTRLKVTDWIMNYPSCGIVPG